MRYALVTGGSRGIGRAVCVALAKNGYNILINCVRGTAEAEKTLALVRETGQDGAIVQFDVSDTSQVRAALTTWSDTHPEEYIEVLVNNAGIRHDDVLLFMDEASWHKVIATTLDGFYNVTKNVLEQMLLHKHGRIVNIASLSGQTGIAGQTNYSAAKGGLIAATKALALEVARKGVTVNAVAPGFIKTDMLEGLDEKELAKGVPMRRLGTPEEVASLVCFLASADAAYITGEVISINGGLHT